MSATGYTDWMARTCADEQRSAVLVEVPLVLGGTDRSEMSRRLDGEDTFEAIDDLADALLDKHIANCDGNVRLALFDALCSLGRFMARSTSERDA